MQFLPKDVEMLEMYILIILENKAMLYSTALYYFVVLPKPPFLISVTSSSNVIPYSTKIP